MGSYASIVTFFLYVCTLFYGLVQPAMAQAGPVDPLYVNILDDRDSFGRVVHLYGDSIMRGYALRRFPDNYSVDESDRELLWEQRSPANVLNLLAQKDSGFTAAYAGGVGLPEKASPIVGYRVKTNIIRPGDVVVFQDGGGHKLDPEGYAEIYMKIRKSICGSGATAIFLNTHHVIAPGSLQIENEDILRWDVQFGEMTMNDAVKKVATEEVDQCEAAIFIDVANELRELEQRGHSVLHSDGYHLNVTGQWAVAHLIERAIRTMPPVQ